jgi:protein SCO1/2
MNERRKFLAGLSAGAMMLLAETATGAAVATATGKKPVAGHQMDRGKLHGPGQIPEVMVETSAGKRLRFYADLIKGKVVLVNYMAIRNENTSPVTTKLLEISRRLGAKLGSEIHIVSITSDPKHDTPARLRAFAKRMGTPEKGWQFVRMSDASSMLVSARLHRHPMAPSPSSRVGVISYGNEPVGLWGLFPVDISPDDAALRIASVFAGKSHGGAPRRAGPRKLGEAGMAFNHRIA